MLCAKQETTDTSAFSGEERFELDTNTQQQSTKHDTKMIDCYNEPTVRDWNSKKRCRSESSPASLDPDRSLSKLGEGRFVSHMNVDKGNNEDQSASTVVSTPAKKQGQTALENTNGQSEELSQKAVKAPSVKLNLDTDFYRDRAQSLLYKNSDIVLHKRKDAFFELVRQLCPYIRVERSGSRTLRTYLVDTRRKKRYRTYSDAIKGGALDPLILETGTTVLLKGCVVEAQERFKELQQSRSYRAMNHGVKRHISAPEAKTQEIASPTWIDWSPAPTPSSSRMNSLAKARSIIRRAETATPLSNPMDEFHGEPSDFFDAPNRAGFNNDMQGLLFTQPEDDVLPRAPFRWPSQCSSAPLDDVESSLLFFEGENYANDDWLTTLSMA